MNTYEIKEENEPVEGNRHWSIEILNPFVI